VVVERVLEVTAGERDKGGSVGAVTCPLRGLGELEGTGKMEMEADSEMKTTKRGRSGEGEKYVTVVAWRQCRCVRR